MAMTQAAMEELLHRLGLEFVHKLGAATSDADPEAAATMCYLGDWLFKRGNWADAATLYRRVNRIYESGDDCHRLDYAVGLSNLGSVLKKLGNYTEALPLLEQSLQVKESLPDADWNAIAITLNNLGMANLELGRHEEAERLFSRALVLREKQYGSAHASVAESKNNLGDLCWERGELPEAELLLRESLNIYLELPGNNTHSIAISSGNLATLLSSQCRFDEAELLYGTALSALEAAAVANLAGIASIRSNFSDLLRQCGRFEEAKAQSLAAISALLAFFGESHIQVARAFTGHAAILWDVGETATAIYFAKRAINIVQQTRHEVSRIDPETLLSFDRTVENEYRALAEMLLKADRITEAEQVLALLKEDEYFDFVRGATTPEALSPQMSYSDDEAGIDLHQRSILSLSARMASLKRKRTRNAAEEAEYLELQSGLEDASSRFSEFMDELDTRLGREAAQRVHDVTTMKSTLWDLDNCTAVIYTLSTRNTLYTILVTGCAPPLQKSFPIASEELAGKVLHFREAMTERAFMGEPKYDVEPMACELYDIILRPLADELKAAGVTTLLWMLDGSLRLLPVCALHDGNDFLVASVCNVYLTTKSRDNLLVPAKPHWTALAMGITEAYGNFRALPAVKAELEGIVKSENSSAGLLPGEIFLNGAFTWEAMSHELDGTYQAVHIASHFQLNAGNESLSYLLLADGDQLTLEKLKNQQALFRGVDLLAVSACSTGVGSASKSGREIDGFGYIAETLGARAVIATLWLVSDESTSLLMTDFYRIREAGATKIEALRQAQLRMLNGCDEPTSAPVPRCGGAPLRFETDSRKPYAHPYYWAPFILIGNYR